MLFLERNAERRDFRAHVQWCVSKSSCASKRIGRRQRCNNSSQHRRCRDGAEKTLERNKIIS